jgi:DNA-binding PadR family transcriptional regulator
MRAVLAERHIGAVVKLRGGSVYDAVGRLLRAGHIEAVGSDRRGARPERTVYALTPSGAALLDELVREYVGSVVREFPAFAAGLAHVLHLPRSDALALLRGRLARLRAEWDATAAALRATLAAGMPRVVLLETEYAQRIRRAEIDWLADVVRDIESGDLPWIDMPSQHNGPEPAQHNGPEPR